MIDLSYLKRTTGNDSNIINELLNVFLEQLPYLKREIVGAFESKNYFALSEAAHKAKNSFEMLGMKNQSEQLKKMEMLALEGKENIGYEAMVASFLKSCDNVEKEIKTMELK